MKSVVDRTYIRYTGGYPDYFVRHRAPLSYGSHAACSCTYRAKPGSVFHCHCCPPTAEKGRPGSLRVRCCGVRRVYARLPHRLGGLLAALDGRTRCAPAQHVRARSSQPARRRRVARRPVRADGAARLAVGQRAGARPPQCSQKLLSTDSSARRSGAPSAHPQRARARTRQATGALHFVLHNGNGAWDNPGGRAGENYTAHKPGSYRLQGCQLLLLPPNLPCLLVRAPPAAARRRRRCCASESDASNPPPHHLRLTLGVRLRRHTGG
jgi:hypothetical protein